MGADHQGKVYLRPHCNRYHWVSSGLDDFVHWVGMGFGVSQFCYSVACIGSGVRCVHLLEHVPRALQK